MRLALRPYATAGIALVGAGVIAVAPVTAPPPEMQTHAVQLSATAVDDPIAVFTPVFDKAATYLQQAIQAEFDDPFPIVDGLIGKASADAQTLSAIAAVFGEAIVSIATNYPAALGRAVPKVAAGDFTGAVAEFTPIFTGPVFQVLGVWPRIPAYVQDQFEVAGLVTSYVMGTAWSATMGQALRVFTLVNAVTGVLDELAIAIPAGDPGRAVNAVQHGVANVADAALSIANGIRVHIDRGRIKVRDALNPPPPPSATAEQSSTPARTDLVTLSLPAAAPATESPVVSGADATPPSSPAAVDTPESAASTTEPVAEKVKETVKPLVRHSRIAVPGKGGIDRAGSDRSTKLASDVSDKISSTVKKVDEGIKKAFAKPKKKAASGSHGSGTGSTGASGDSN
ncbi:hypothetical protein [Mycobacterium sp. DL440]|uniref:hypothetical protein n=1 Tax=Mycobacterium sp. DL440 TaxID=2675523 RepID=UPI00141DFA10|nr:hypothetical protein [Mycobacterium sp. DL440]